MKTQTPAYLPHLDGLRSLAILAVVLFHAFPKLLPGGFAGVDMFFVISGFLITRILLYEQTHSQFSLLRFWQRRFLRLFPHLLLMLAAVLPMGWWILYPSEFQELGKQALAGILFVSNFLYAGETGYFATPATLKPLLHLWSLGIEEQFYLLWPLVILLCGGKHLGKVLCFMLLLSWGVSVYRVHSDPVQAFYLPDSRLWELLIGCGIAFAESQGKIQLEKRLRNICFALGVTLLLTAFLLCDSSTLFPGYWALFPTLGTAFLIVSGGTVASRASLENPFSVWLGKLSYPIYLWHWPLLVFCKIMEIQSTEALMIGIVLAVVIAFISDTFVRSLQYGKRKTTPAIAMSAVLLASVSFPIYQGSLKTYSERFNFAEITTAFDDWAFPPKSAHTINDENRNYYVIGEPVNSDTVVFLGDSNLEQYGPSVERLIQDGKGPQSAVFATAGGCAPFRGFGRTDGRWCDGLLETEESFIRKYQFKTIVIGAFWYGYYVESQHYLNINGQKVFMGGHGKNFDLWLKELRQQLLDYKSQGHIIYLIGNMPVAANLNPHNMVNRNVFRGPFEKKIAPVHISELDPEINIINTKLDALAKEAGVIFLNPVAELCAGGLCPVWGPQGPLYKDGAHVRPSTAAQLKFLAPIFK